MCSTRSRVSRAWNREAAAWRCAARREGTKASVQPPAARIVGSCWPQPLELVALTRTRPTRPMTAFAPHSPRAETAHRLGRFLMPPARRGGVALMSCSTRRAMTARRGARPHPICVCRVVLRRAHAPVLARPTEPDLGTILSSLLVFSTHDHASPVARDVLSLIFVSRLFACSAGTKALAVLATITIAYTAVIGTLLRFDPRPS